MKITLAQVNYHTGNFEYNTQQIITAIQKAKDDKSDLVVFAELSVCGYPPRDFLLFNDFITQSNHAVNAIAKHCVGIAAIIGAPTVNPVIEGKDLYNSALFLANGKIEQVVHKTLLPTYDIFDEYRYFEPNNTFNTITYKDVKIALTICEDLWNLNENPMYVKSPMDELIKQQPDVIINIAASPFHKSQIQTRQAVLKNNATKYQLPIFYVNHIGAQTHLIFDGGSCVIGANGFIVDELNYFKEDIKSYLVNGNRVEPTTVGSSQTVRQKYEDLEAALVLGIRQYFKKLHFNKAILGLSGGIDSALVLYLAAKALGSDNVLGVMLPSAFSSEHSISDSIVLANNLGVKTYEIPIADAVDAFDKTLQPYFVNTTFGITEENIQSRTRAVILMALSNKFGYILLNTSNKSELAVGYGTLYGDMCGGLSVIGDLYKTEVFELCKYINRNEEVIPNHILTKEPSAELRPNQKDSDSLPPYEELDALLYQYVEEAKDIKQLIQMGFDADLTKRVLKMVVQNEWKRWQSAPVLRVSKRAFGYGRRMPISGKYDFEIA